MDLTPDPSGRPIAFKHLGMGMQKYDIVTVLCVSRVEILTCHLKHMFQTKAARAWFSWSMPWTSIAVDACPLWRPIQHDKVCSTLHIAYELVQPGLEREIQRHVRVSVLRIWAGNVVWRHFINYHNCASDDLRNISWWGGRLRWHRRKFQLKLWPKYWRKKKRMSSLLKYVRTRVSHQVSLFQVENRTTETRIRSSWYVNFVSEILYARYLLIENE